MKHNIFGIAAIATQLTILPLGMAQTNGQSSADLSSTPDGLYIYGGMGAGVVDLATKTAGEVDKSGSQLNFKLLGRYDLSPDFDIAAGFGWMKNSFDQKKGSTAVDVSTRAGFAELVPAYRLFSQFRLGPAVLWQFGTDLSYSEQVGNKSQALFGGLQMAYQIDIGSTRLRPYLQAVRDLTVAGRNVTIAQIGLEFGLPLLAGSNDIQSDKIYVQQAAPAAPVVAAPVIAPVEVVKIDLDDQFFYFDTNRSDLKPGANRYLTRVADLLAEYPEAWSLIRIRAHTDQRGPTELNRELSWQRAISVKDALKNDGVPGDRIDYEGYGESDLVDAANTPSAWASNRRAQLLMMGISENSELMEKIQVLNKEFRR